MPTTFTSTTAPKRSPWGHVQYSRELAPGAWLVTTAGHGGIKLSRARVAALPAACRVTPYSGGGWFEEDVDSLIPIAAFPDIAASFPYFSTPGAQTPAQMVAKQADYFGAERLAALGITTEAK